MVCVPTLKLEIVKVPCAEALSVTLEASVVAPSVKVTVPVAVPEPGGVALTVAVNVTACPNPEGLTVGVTVVVVSAGLTCGVTAVETALDQRRGYPLLTQARGLDQIADVTEAGR